MAFAEDYKYEITLAYYCVSLALTSAIFVFGTIYLRHRDGRFAKMREWRQFAETINSEYNKLKTKNIPQKIEKLKASFEKVQVGLEITGLDVLRYMMDDVNYEHFRTTSLKCLREDLESIFQLLNVCSSLLLLGTVPINIKAELGQLVTNIGQMTLPFFKGTRRETILKCLEHFGSGRPSRESERRVREKDSKLENSDVPYVESCLKFLSTNEESSLLYMHFYSKRRPIGELGTDYGECDKFTLDEKLHDIRVNQLTSQLVKLHDGLVDKKYASDFARELKNLQKVLHEVRTYIHRSLKENWDKLSPHDREFIERKTKELMKVLGSVTRLRPNKAIVGEICRRFSSDLSSLMESQHEYHESAVFMAEFQELYGRFKKIRVKRQEPEAARTVCRARYYNVTPPTTPPTPRA